MQLGVSFLDKRDPCLLRPVHWSREVERFCTFPSGVIILLFLEVVELLFTFRKLLVFGSSCEEKTVIFERVMVDGLLLKTLKLTHQ